MKRASLQFKMLLIVAGCMGFVLLISVFALQRVYRSVEDLDRIAREDFQTQKLIVKGHGLFNEQVQEWKNVLLRGKTAVGLERHWSAFEQREKEVAETVKEALVGAGNEDVRAQLTAFGVAHKAAGERFRKGLEAFKAGDLAAGDAATEGASELPARILQEAATKADEIGSASTMAAVTSSDAVYRYSLVTLVVVMVLAMAALWIFMRRSVLEPLRSGARVAERIAEGDLTAEIRAHSRDEAGQLLSSLARMNDGLARVVSQVRNAAHAVASAAEQVQVGTTDLSQRTEEQASSLEETAASMEELASTVKQNADNAREADSLARSASKRAEQGGSEVVNVVMTMGDISDSARRIADIISVIDGIAFQTNILALNAAVEAARAGEQGRGFAVVAAEVRSLAQRSAQAAKEIKDLIGTSVSKVETGTRLVEQAGDTIQALVIDVKRVSELMGSIAEASAEQARGVQQVNKTVTEMDRVVQQNAAAVQQSATAAEAMRRNAETLVRAVGTFQLTLEERVGDAHADHEPHPAGIAPAPAVRDMRDPAPAAPRLGQPKARATAGAGDDWEEF